MIHVEFINGALPRLTGDATKLAVHLCVLGATPIRADKRWCAQVAKKIGMTSAAVAKAARELAKEKLIGLAGRVNLVPIDAPMSPPGHSLARVSPGQKRQLGESAGGENDETPPWDRGVDERSETTGEGEGSRNAVVCSPHALVVRGIDGMFFEAYASRPTWGPKQGAILKSLLKKHSPDEVLRRAEIMFFDSRKWPAPPYDVATLSVHFDKFAVGKGRGGMIGDTRKTGEQYFGEVDDV